MLNIYYIQRYKYENFTFIFNKYKLFMINSKHTLKNINGNILKLYH